MKHELTQGMRAAIEAMREPTREMRKAGRRKLHECVDCTLDLNGDPDIEYDDPEPVWSAMIDEALRG